MQTKNKYIVMLATIILLSGCGIFKKKCDCPKFEKKKKNSFAIWKISLK